MFLDPDRKVKGHPVEVLEVSPASTESFLWNARLRIVVDEHRHYESSVHLAKDRAVVIAKLPPDPQAFRILIAARGSSREGPNPLADAIEAVAKRP